MPARPERAPLLLFAAGNLRPGAGGIAELSREVVAALLELRLQGRIRLQVCVLEGQGPEPGDALFGGAGGAVIEWFSGSRFRFALRVARAEWALQLFDHVGLARLPGLLPRRLRRPYALLVHGVEIWRSERGDYHRTAARAQLLIANSAYTREKARARHENLPEIRVCWPGRDPCPKPVAEASSIPWTIGPHAMLIVGRLAADQRHKGHDQLLEALPLILQAVPDAQLIVAGGGDDRPRLEARAGELGVSGQVIFTGFADRSCLEKLYARCALFVMPSDGDGFGLVFLEAMMHGKPCVGLRGSAAGEIFEDGVSGLLVDREQARDMARALAGLLQDEARRRRMGAAALARYQQHFTAGHFAMRLQGALMGWLGSSPVQR
jgi:phosphatidylinositol alpha-1,6-mannosyltransferase